MEYISYKAKQNNLKPLAVYIHYPFCIKKCPYCDFNSHIKEDLDYREFLKGYLAEIKYFKEKLLNHKHFIIDTIYWGGGTPSLMPAYFVEKILELLNKEFNVSSNVEITLEANPSSAEISLLKQLKFLGVNRISLGVQSFNDDELKFLGRVHNAVDAYKALDFVSNHFDNYSFDLIYSLPNQTLQMWAHNLTNAIKFSNYHLSLYQLTIEKGTKFYTMHKNNKFKMLSEDIRAEFYEKTQNITQKLGFNAYEVSNYAKIGYESKHNLHYWNFNNYIGIGAGAHSRIQNQAEEKFTSIVMEHNPKNWLKKTQDKGNAIQSKKILSKDELISEVLLMGLRLQDGIKNSELKRKFDITLSEIIDLSKLKLLVEQQLILVSDEMLKVTEKGVLLLNSITNYIINYAGTYNNK